MQVALSYAQKANDMNEVPIGAIIVRNNQVIGAGHNSTITKNSVTAHAELEAIDAAGTLLGNHRLIDCDMYVTVEPCHMCAKAIVHARLRKLFIGCLEPKEGAIFSQYNFFDKILSKILYFFLFELIIFFSFFNCTIPIVPCNSVIL